MSWSGTFCAIATTIEREWTGGCVPGSEGSQGAEPGAGEWPDILIKKADYESCDVICLCSCSTRLF